MDGDERLREAEAALDAAREQDDELSLARALLGRARALRAVGRTEPAVADLDELIARFPAGDDLSLRERLTEALMVRLRWSRAEPAETLATTRTVFGLCNGEPSTVLERRAALALGMQADAQRRLGDLPAAIATRRWLLSEFGDVRPRTRPELVLDHTYLLARDLCAGGELDEAARTGAALVATLDADDDVPLRETRIADAMVLSIYALSRHDERRRAAAIGAELQRRFADAREPRARVAACRGLAMIAQGQLRDDDVAAALVSERELLLRAAAASDDESRLPIAVELQRLADDLVAGFGPVSFLWRTMIVARLSRRSPRLLRRRRLRRASAAIARVDAGAEAIRMLEQRFADDDSPTGRAIHGRAVLQRAIVASRRGCLGASAAAVRDFAALPPATIAAVLDDARSLTTAGGYRLTDLMAAVIALTLVADLGPDPARVRGRARAIVGSDSTPALHRLAERVFRSDGRFSAAVPAGRAPGSSSRAPRGRC